MDPDQIIFSDESRFSLDGSDCMYSWTKGNDYFKQMRPFKGGSIMIWGAIAKSGLIIIRKIKGTLNSEKYCKLMENDIIPILNDHLGTYIFQQDNATCHVSKVTQEMFKRNGVPLLPWPPKSPDLSPIEQLWGILKKRMYDESHFINLDQVWSRIEEEIAKINTESPELISDMYKNYLSKMCDILCNGGCLLK